MDRPKPRALWNANPEDWLAQVGEEGGFNADPEQLRRIQMRPGFVACRLVKVTER